MAESQKIIGEKKNKANAFWINMFFFPLILLILLQFWIQFLINFFTPDLVNKSHY